MKSNILIVDDNTNVLSALYQLLEDVSDHVTCIKQPDLIPGILETRQVDLIIMDMNFTRGATDGKEGIAWLRRILDDDPETVVIMITAYSEVDLAIEAIKCGATDFISKPWDNEKLLATIRSGLLLSSSRFRIKQLESKKDHLNTCLHSGHERMQGKSSQMLAVYKTITKVSSSDTNVLVLGENGTGKELIARQIHQESDRSDEVFVHVDLGSISESLFESELFGHAKGAFTDAKDDKAGRIEIASGGTLFLDEIGNLSPEMQSKLLNVLQNREIYRLGSNKPISANFRLISATNQDLRKLISQKEFREDLYYRINTIEITAPPLRERGRDVLDLAQFFLEKHSHKYHKQGLGFSGKALDLIGNHSWPGNVRQLQHSIERAVLLAEKRLIEPGDILPGEGGQNWKEVNRPTLLELELMTIRESILRNRGNLSKVARELGVARSTLYNKMRSYDIQ